MIKKIITMLLGITAINMTATVYADDYAKFNANGININIREWGSPYWQSSGYRNFMEKNKVTYVAMEGSADSKSSLYFDIDDAFLYGQQCDMTVTIEYFDEGTTDFTFNYESYNTESFIYEKKSQPLKLTDTNALKSISFNLSDVVLENRYSNIGGSDFYINLEKDTEGNRGNLLIKSIKFSVNDTPTFLATELYSEKYGNIFTTNEQNATLEITNKSSESYSGAVEYSVIYNEEEILNTEEISVDLAANETITIPFEFDYSKYGIYDLQVKAVNGNKIHADILPFSIINATKKGEGNKHFYVCTHFSWYGNEGLDAISLAGFGGIRGGIAWSQVEKEKGVLKLPSHADAVTKDVADAGLSFLNTLSLGNVNYDQEEYKAANDGKVTELVAPYTDEGIAAYANYSRFMAENVKQYTHTYEIWNEYNYAGFNKEERGPDVYAKMLKAAATAIREADPEATIVAMATSQTYVNFIKAVINEGTEDYFDVISVHPYQWSGSYSEASFLRNMRAVNALSDKPVWCTELGWSSSEHKWGVSEKEQMIFGIKEYVISQAKDLCDRIFWYDFQNDGTDITNIEDNFGLIEAIDAEEPHVAKPAYVAFAALNKLLGKSEYVDCEENDKYRAYRFEDENGVDTLVLWGNPGTRVALDLGTDNVQIMDIYSNVKEDAMRDHGVYKITFDDEITYIRGNFDEYKESTETNLKYCNVRYKDGYVYVDGEAQKVGERITVYVYSDNNKHIYSNQIIADEDAKFEFKADIKGESEVYVRVNYGELVNKTVPDIAIKLVCNGKEITSAEQIDEGNIEMVISINKAFDRDVDFFGAVYNSNTLADIWKQEILSGMTGKYSFPIELREGMKFDRISGYIWNKDLSPVEKKDF